MPAAKQPRTRPDSATDVPERYRAALDRLVARLEQDRAVIAAILCGSLSHDTVWSRSDIDLVIITADDRQAQRQSLTIDADGIHVHAIIFPRTEFRKLAEGSLHNSFTHSFVAKGRLLFTHDPTVADLHARLQVIGDRDTQVQLLRAAAGALSCIDKARKWLVTRGDLDYSALWILYASISIARMEFVGRKLLADREVLPQAAALNPELFRPIYSGLLNAKKTRASVERGLDTLERYVRDRAPQIFALVLDYLREAGEARSCTEIEDYFKRHYDIEDVTAACEYLAGLGLVGKAAIAARITTRSTVDVPELAFFHLSERGA